MFLDCFLCCGFYIFFVNEGLFCFVGYKWNMIVMKREVVYGVCNFVICVFRVIFLWDEFKIYNMLYFIVMLVDNFI